MPFWSSETLKRKIPADSLVKPYCEKAVKHCAYELAMGGEAVITEKPKLFRKRPRTTLEPRGPLVIPPGQFGMLLTEEFVKVPHNAIAFISIRAGIKFKGLVNISGFHVDPGFSGRLKFAVYNAGSDIITICRGDRVFMIWYADLDFATTDPYGPNKPEQNEITAQDIERASGEIFSPAQLKSDLKELSHKVTILMLVATILITIFGAIAGRLLIADLTPRTPSTAADNQKDDVARKATSPSDAQTQAIPHSSVMPRPSADQPATGRSDTNVASFGPISPQPSTNPSTRPVRR